MRLGVGYYGEIRNENDKHDEIYENTSFDSKYYNYRLNCVCNFIYYINPFSRFDIFWGLGPEGRFSYNYHENPKIDNSDYTDKYCSNSWAIGLNGVLGAEWMPVSDFSVFAEYEATGLYGKSHYTSMVVTKQNYYTEKNEGNYEEWSFEGNRALLGISVYFDKLF